MFSTSIFYYCHDFVNGCAHTVYPFIVMSLLIGVFLVYDCHSSDYVGVIVIVLLMGVFLK